MDRNRVLTVGVTLFTAFAIGHVMQNGGASASKVKATDDATPATASATAPRVDAALQPASLPALPSDLHNPIPLAAPPAAIPYQLAAATGIELPVLNDAVVPGFAVPGCAAEFAALAAADGMVFLTLSAPCHPSERVEIEHAGIAFTEIVGQNGKFSLSVPAMSAAAPFIARFGDGTSVTAQVDDLDLRGLDRAAISWTGTAALSLHAFEFGARYGEPGHVTSAENGQSSGLGKVFRLGNPGTFNAKMAEIYTFPRMEAERDGVVRLVVEAEVSGEACGATIRGHTMQTFASGDASQIPIELNMPQCMADGGYLVLKNLLQDLKIASN